MELRLGSLRLPSLVIQSPMAACSDLPFRLVAREKGLGFSFLEMVSAQALVRDNGKTKRLMATAEGDRPLGAQLLGCDPGMMAAAAETVEGMGFDLLDLNLGCPVKKVTSNGEGSALLKEPEKAEKVFRAVRKAVKKIPVTVKMRKGFSDPSGDEAVELAKRAEASGFDAVTVHGRTQAQQYTGKADWVAIGKVKAAVNIPVIGNGDVVSGQDAKRLKEISGCDGIMIGRAGLGNPWVYRNLHGAMEGSDAFYVPSLDERRDTLLRHFDLEVSLLGERLAAVNMRRIGYWYSAGLPNAKVFRVAVCSTMDVRVIRSAILEFFGSLPQDCPAPQTPLLLAE